MTHYSIKPCNLRTCMITDATLENRQIMRQWILQLSLWLKSAPNPIPTNWIGD